MVMMKLSTLREKRVGGRVRELVVSSWKRVGGRVQNLSEGSCMK